MRERRFSWAAILLCTACPGDSGDTEASTGGATSTASSDETTAGPTGSPGSEGTAGPSTGAEPTSAGPTSGETSQGPTSGETATSGETTASETTASETTASETSGETSSGPGTSETTGGGQVCEGEDHEGKATYYAADGSGNCSFDADPGDDMVAAMNTPDYMASAVCGACVQIDGPDGQIVVRIVDRCPECQSGHIDLDEDAFPMIADKNLGVVPITWRYVSCDPGGPIVYHFKEGSNQWWTAVQIRHHRNAIAKLEFKNQDDAWQDVARLEYNYFVAEQGMGPGPYAFRVTDVHGNVLEDAGIPFVEAGDSPGAGQFPACAP